RGIGRQTAGHGCSGEQHRAEYEDAAAAEAIARRAANQDQGAEQQEVSVDHPLRRRDRYGEFGLNRRQRDIDDGRVDESHAGAEDRRRQHPRLAALGAGLPHGTGFDDTVIARRPAERQHRANPLSVASHRYWATTSPASAAS